jgi:hypothetical protein
MTDRSVSTPQLRPTLQLGAGPSTDARKAVLSQRWRFTSWCTATEHGGWQPARTPQSGPRRWRSSVSCCARRRWRDVSHRRCALRILSVRRFDHER